ncbi:hypothetical protein COB55_01500 [Candidatus Wolfebacteria bacterium]|nr:MAG: hypothetical protein COB55_01500 [Candidatus Wolfebacteria bacterium]
MIDSVPVINIDYIFFQIHTFVASVGDFPAFWNATILPVLYPLSFIVSVFFITVTVYSLVRLTQMGNMDGIIEENREIEKKAVSDGNTDKRLNERWIRVKELSASQSESDWRMAVIEADGMLEEMINKMGYDGSSLGEKMKQIEKSDFNTIQQAWDAHIVRNQIAHAGIEFALSEREKNRVIGLYKEVFEEFYYI